MSSSNILRLIRDALARNGEQLDLVSGDVVKIRPLQDDTGAINIGDGTYDVDVKIFLGSTTEYVEFDVGNSRMTVACPIAGAGSTNIPFIPIAAPEDIAAGTGGALSVATYLSTVDTDAGGDAFTLADGSQVGQLKKVHLITDGGGNGTITPANFQDGSTVTLADAGDYVIFAWEAAGWRAIELGNSVDGVSAPAVA